MPPLNQIFTRSMIDVIILTSSNTGSASVQLEQLIKSKKVTVKAVILNKGLVHDKIKYYKTKIKKAFKIGLFGTFNGIRMRKWYSTGASGYLNNKSIKNICDLQGIPFHITSSINCLQTIEYFEKARADIGLSLGNGYIGRKVFSIPKFGMINIHHEELPAYQNAQSILWQLYNNSSNTGYTIHKIDQHIDTGEILYKEMIAITFKENLENTVSFNYAELLKKSAIGLLKVLEDFDTYYENSTPQGHGGSYTTPSLWQYLRIQRNFRKIKKVHAPNNV